MSTSSKSTKPMGLLARLLQHLTYANVVATIALFLALGTSGAYAVNEWTGKNIKNGTITNVDVKNGTISAADVKNGTLSGADIKDGTIAGEEMAPGAVTREKVAAAAVGSQEVENGTITGDDIKDGTIAGEEMAPGAVTREKVAAAAVGSQEVENGTITGDDIKDGTITSGNIKNGTIGDIDIQDNSISTFDLADNSVDSDEVLDFGLTNEDIGVMYAQVASDGTLSSSSGGVTSTRIGLGQYSVDFGRNITSAAFIATQGEAGSGAPSGAMIGVADRLNNNEAVFVTVRDADGAFVDRAFQLVVVN